MNLVIFIIECDAAFVKDIGTKNDVVSKIHRINNKSRVVVNNNVSIEFRELDFSRAMSAVDMVAPASEKICRSSVEEIGI